MLDAFRVPSGLSIMVMSGLKRKILPGWIYDLVDDGALVLDPINEGRHRDSAYLVIVMC